jgi:hypothetical protein
VNLAEKIQVNVYANETGYCEVYEYANVSLTIALAHRYLNDSHSYLVFYNRYLIDCQSYDVICLRRLPDMRNLGESAVAVFNDN